MKRQNRKQNPTWSDVTLAKREAMRRSLYLILYVLIDKHDAPLEDIQRLSDEVNYLADSIVKGYVTWRDIERVVVNDYGVSLPW